jgi:threonine synthase
MQQRGEKKTGNTGAHIGAYRKSKKKRKRMAIVTRRKITSGQGIQMTMSK